MSFPSPFLPWLLSVLMCVAEKHPHRIAEWWLYDSRFIQYITPIHLITLNMGSIRSCIFNNQKIGKQFVRHERGDSLTQSKIGQSLGEILRHISHKTLSHYGHPLLVSYLLVNYLRTVLGFVLHLCFHSALEHERDVLLIGLCLRPSTWQLLHITTNMKALPEMRPGHLDCHTRFHPFFLLSHQFPLPENLLGLLTHLQTLCKLRQGSFLVILPCHLSENYPNNVLNLSEKEHSLQSRTGIFVSGALGLVSPLSSWAKKTALHFPS